MHFATQSTLSRHVPLERAKGLASARSQVIGIACLANTPRTCSLEGLESHVQMDDCRSAPRLIPIPKIRRHGVGIGLGVGAAGFEAVTGGCAGREGVAEHALPGLHDEVAKRR